MSEDIYIVRHAETVNAEKGIIDGRYSDSELTHRGIDQARVLGDTFRKMMPGIVISSDSGRAARTAKIMMTQMYPAAYHETPLLRERGFGDLEGRCFRSAGISEKDAPYFYAADTAHYNPESLGSVWQRLRQFLYDLLFMCNEEPIAIVGHNWINSYLTNILLKHDAYPDRFFPMPNCGIRRFQPNGGMFSPKDVFEYSLPESIDEMIFLDGRD